MAQKLCMLLLNLVGWFYTFTAHTFLPLFLIYRRGSFVYHQFILIYLIPLDPLNFAFMDVGIFVNYKIQRKADEFEICNQNI